MSQAMVNISENTNVAIIKNMPIDNVITMWLEFTKPMHSLMDCEIKVFSRFLYYRYLYSKDILDVNLLDKHILSTEVRSIVKNDLELTQARFQNLMSSLRRKGVFEANGKIKPKFIPNIKQGSKSFKILINFTIADGTTKGQGSNADSN